ncbi:hypothetical protein YDYSY3_07280 [Paenibacillus chitinolyticus]|uniref:hypothetical protein n=1 Tax=Paenibacillus chitinolyticus TaxID=79263 RepID=UPI0026E4E7CF|nr:hypothetical protein [Paenibacillus chitinolyticus]GKS09728.1 hypothetical protein YDYSY3_07280 [Paenibacillus chitinolyticus]
MEIFTEHEAHQQIKQLKEQIESLEEQIVNLEKQVDFSESDHLEKLISNLKQFLAGIDEMEEREANDILTEFVDTIIYTKIGGDIEMDIVMKNLNIVDFS